MTFPIDVNIPAANNDPADDQPLMQQNFSNINGYLQVDHTNPSATGAGQHKQVTFNSNNVPSLPTSFPTLFTNNQDGGGNNLPGSVSELFFYSGTSTQSSNQYRALSTGSTMVLGGTILKWGSTGAVADNATVSFVTAFPNNCFAVLLTITDPNATSKTINVKSATLSTSGFGVRVSSGSISAYYLAIGN